MTVESGNHLRIVREFMQQSAINGSDVTWGSNDVLRFAGVTVDDMERLAQRIKEAVLKENAAAISASLWPSK